MSTKVVHKLEDEQTTFGKVSPEITQERGDDAIKMLHEQLIKERTHRKQDQKDYKDCVNKLNLDLEQEKALRKQDQDEIERLKLEMANFKEEVEILIKDLDNERTEAKEKITQMMAQMADENEQNQEKLKVLELVKELKTANNEMKVKVAEMEQEKRILLEKVQAMDVENKNTSNKSRELVHKLKISEEKQLESIKECEKYGELNKELSSEVRKLLEDNSKLLNKNRSIVLKYERLQDEQREANEKLQDLLEKRTDLIQERKKCLHQMECFDGIVKNLQDENKRLQEEIIKLLNKVDLLEQVHNMEDFYKLRMALLKQIDHQKKEIDHMVVNQSTTNTSLFLPSKSSNDSENTKLMVLKNEEKENAIQLKNLPVSENEVDVREVKHDTVSIDNVVDDVKLKLEEYIKSTDYGKQLFQWKKDHEDLCRKLEQLEVENRQLRTRSSGKYS